jgi:H+/Cl- antiporter ClcA
LGNYCKIYNELSTSLSSLVVIFLVFQGIWGGMLGGTCMQFLILLYVTIRTDWNKEVLYPAIIAFIMWFDYFVLWSIILELSNRIIHR